jgi:4-hydroxy-2-oxoheptanedioate aldolase
MKSHISIYERLLARPAVVGLLQTHPNLALTELVGLCGYDFLILDAEHGVFSDKDFTCAIQTLAGTDLVPMVRLAGCDAQSVGRYLDMGAEAIVVPNVVSAEQARDLVRGMHYPPHGTRGFGASTHRASRYGIELAEHLNDPRGGRVLMVMIESKQGVENIDGILAVDGVDGVFIGPFDLSADLGGAGNFSTPEYVEALSQVERAAVSRGKLLGTGPHPGHPVSTLLARGHRLLLIGADMPLIREAMLAQVSQARLQHSDTTPQER